MANVTISTELTPDSMRSRQPFIRISKIVIISSKIDTRSSKIIVRSIKIGFRGSKISIRSSKIGIRTGRICDESEDIAKCKENQRK